jgi:hypothetical protein
MKWNFGAFLWCIFIIALLAVGWKGRNTLPLHWKTGASLPVRFLAVGGLVAIVGLYVWWANRRDFK